MIIKINIIAAMLVATFIAVCCCIVSSEISQIEEEWRDR